MIADLQRPAASRRDGVARLFNLPGGSHGPVAFGSGAGGFTLLEILLALALVALMLVALNSFVFSMGELWGRGSDVRLFDQHARAVTRFLEHELRTAALPPAAVARSTPIGLQQTLLPQAIPDYLFTFELPSGSRLFTWPDPKRPLPEVVCSLQVREKDGLILLWHSRLEKNFDTDPPRETVVTPLVTGMSYDYYDADSTHWTTETTLRADPSGGATPLMPQRLRLKFTYGKLTHESVISLPAPTEALPLF
jgi:prepilin-type N-terminal cleavage/methylation domain-containing protein